MVTTPTKSVSITKDPTTTNTTKYSNATGPQVVELSHTFPETTKITTTQQGQSWIQCQNEIQEIRKNGYLMDIEHSHKHFGTCHNKPEFNITCSNTINNMFPTNKKLNSHDISPIVECGNIKQRQHSHLQRTKVERIVGSKQNHSCKILQQENTR